MLLKALIRKAVVLRSSVTKPVIKVLPISEQNLNENVIKIEVSDAIQSNRGNFPISQSFISDGNFDVIEDGNLGFIKDVSIADERGKCLIVKVDAEHFVKSIVNQFKSMNDVKSIGNLFPSRESKKRILIEYSSPNIAKSFHVGHLRSTLIGNFVSNVQTFLGNDVIRLNYLGDWGTQYGLLSLGFDLFGNENELTNNPISHLNEVYVKINSEVERNESVREEAKERFRQLESKSNEKLVEQWKRFRDISLMEFGKTYQRLGISFDAIHGESMYTRKECDSVLKQLEEKNMLAKDSSGAMHFRIRKSNSSSNESTVPLVKSDGSSFSSSNESTVPLIKSDGCSLYLTRDVVAAIHRKQLFNFDKIFYVVESYQAQHLNHLKLILESLDCDWTDSLHHVKFGRILGMSSRKGQVVTLDQLLNEAKVRSLEAAKVSGTTKVPMEEYESLADTLGISSILVNDMKAPMTKNYTFDWHEVLAREGNTGTSLQYTHSTLVSLEKENSRLAELITRNDYKLNERQIKLLISEPASFNLLTSLSRFDDSLIDSNDSNDPHSMARFLFMMKKSIGRARNELNVKHASDEEAAMAWLTLFMVSRNVVATGMKLIGLTPVEKM